MKISKATKILISMFLLVAATMVRAETVISNVVSVSSDSGAEGEASVNTHIISTVNGETTEYHYGSEGNSTSTTYSEVIVEGKVGSEREERTRATYLKLIERLLDLIEVLQAKNLSK